MMPFAAIAAIAALALPRRMALAAAAAADPDIIAFMPCGYQLAQTLPEARALLAAAPWRDLRAAREGRAFAVDGHHLFNRPGPRLVESAQVLACLLRPDDEPVPRSRAPLLARL